MLIMGWRKHLPIHGEDQEPQEHACVAQIQHVS
jgi:hypothetical protein